MDYQDLTDSATVAKWFDTTDNNIRKTYKKGKPDVYKAQCIAAFILENDINATELQFLVNMMLSMRKPNAKKTKTTSRRVSKKAN